MWLGVRSCVIACLLSGAMAAPASSINDSDVPMIKLKIRIPDSTEVVDTEVDVNSTIPTCVKRDPNTIEQGGVIVISAEIFTECARVELSRIQDDLSKPIGNNGLKRGNKAQKDQSLKEAGNSTTATNASADSRQEPSIRDIEKVNHNILAQHTINKDKSANGSDVVKAAGSSSDMMSVIQTVFDYKRVINDLKRILRGDVFSVMGEYPGRMNGLFKMVQELPKRLMKSIGIVNRLRTDTTDHTFRGMLTNLRDYLTQASQTAKSLPEAFNMIRVVETLKNVASKIGDGMYRRVDKPLSQRALLSRVEELLTHPVREILPRVAPANIHARLLSTTDLIHLPLRLIPDFRRSHPASDDQRPSDKKE